MSATRTVVLIALVLCVRPAGAQAPSVDATLTIGITEMRDGDFLKAIFTLNDVVRALTDRADAAPTLARAHAYRAAAYLGLNEPERAMAAALLALRADPKIVVRTPDFPSSVVRLFADPAGFAATRAVESAPRAPNISAPPAAAAPAVVPAAVAPPAIYVYWPAFTGRVTQKVLCDGAHVADLGGSRFILLHAAAGTHIVSFGGKAVSVLFADGQDYYLRGSMKGKIMAGPVLEVVGAEDARAEMRVQANAANDAKRTFSSECLATGQLRKR